MNITVTVTEKEILQTSNDFELGGLVRNKYWQERRNQEGPTQDDEHFFLNIGDDGLVKSISHSSRWDGDQNMDEKDRCVICGKETPYLRSTHIDIRVGYVEGGGQGCYQPNVCDKI